MNVIVSVRDIDGVMHARAFEPDEAAKARAYLSGILPHAEEREQPGIVRALASLDRIVDPLHAYDDVYTMPNAVPAWVPDP
ncbi:MAG TPA: hypothetical protein VFN69_04565 [Rudaea sp.]|nr:hypothetical protein [Rudaea sp.]